MKLINIRIGDLFTHFLLLAALLTVSWRLEATGWVPGLDRIGWLITTGYFFGCLLGYSQFKALAVLFLTIAYTVLGVTWQTLHLVESKTLVLREILIHLSARLSNAMFAFLNNLPVEDPVLFYISLGILIWLTSVLAAFFFIRKKSPWVALALSAIFLLLIDYFPPYAEHPGRHLGIFIFLLLIIIGRIWYLKSQAQWIQKGYRIDSETGFNILKSIAFSSLVVVIFAWNIPTVASLFVPGSESRNNVSEFWIDFRTRISNIFASLEAPFYSATDFYEDSLRLGSNVPVGYETLFLVHVPDRDAQDLRFYWRGHSFDTYRSGEWINTFNQREQASGFIFNELAENYTGRRSVELEYELKANYSKTMYLPMIPGWVDQSVFLIGAETFGESDADMMSVQPVFPFSRGDKFQAMVYASQPTVLQLRSAGINYPDWILENYLQLPENFPTRIQALASEIVAEADTPYDQVAAITRYLRMEIAYEPLLTIPPQVDEPIDWMLFESKSGFCNYYATAEVLMLRSIGVPARFAAGYAQGEPAGDSYYNVRVRDSHAWPEVFFPGVGWVEFEPTSAQPVRDLPPGETAVTRINLDGLTGNNLLSGSEPPKDIDAFLDEEGPEVVTRPGTLFLSDWLWLVVLLAFSGSVILLDRYILRPRKMTVPGAIKTGVEKFGLGIPGWLSAWAAYAALSRIQKYEAQFAGLAGLIGLEMIPGDTVQQRYTRMTHIVPEIKQEMLEFINLFYENQYHEIGIEQKKLDTLARKIRKEVLIYWFTYKVRL